MAENGRYHDIQIFMNPPRVLQWFMNTIIVGNMRSLTPEMVCEYRRYLDQVRSGQKTREKEYMHGYVDNFLPRETVSKDLHTMVLKLLELYTYTDIKEQIIILS